MVKTWSRVTYYSLPWCGIGSYWNNWRRGKEVVHERCREGCQVNRLLDRKSCTGAYLWHLLILGGSGNINQVINRKNLLDFSKPYADTIANSMLHFPDTSGSADIWEFNSVKTTHGVSITWAWIQEWPWQVIVTTTRGSTTGRLFVGDTSNNLILPLNRDGFFESFRDPIRLPGKIRWYSGMALPTKGDYYHKASVVVTEAYV